MTRNYRNLWNRVLFSAAAFACMVFASACSVGMSPIDNDELAVTTTATASDECKSYVGEISLTQFTQDYLDYSEKLNSHNAAAGVTPSTDWKKRAEDLLNTPVGKTELSVTDLFGAVPQGGIEAYTEWTCAASSSDATSVPIVDGSQYAGAQLEFPALRLLGGLSVCAMHEDSRGRPTDIDAETEKKLSTTISILCPSS